MKNKIIAALGILLAVSIAAQFTTSAKAQQRNLSRAMVVRYKTVWTQGQNPNVMIGIVTDFVSASPGCPIIPPGTDVATAFAVIQDSGLERLPQTIYGEVHFETPKK